MSIYTCEIDGPNKFVGSLHLFDRLGKAKVHQDKMFAAGREAKVPGLDVTVNITTRVNMLDTQNLHA